MKKLLSIAIISIITISTFASTTIELRDANTDITDQESLKNGAKLFVNYCLGCHSISFMRYSRIAKDLNMSKDEVKKDLILGYDKRDDLIISSMSPTDAIKWFGAIPPDLSLIARSKSTDWIYTYLHSFYEDEKGIFGVNNHVLKNVSMPDVLWSLKDSQSADKFNKDVKDIVNFLDYVSEPAKLIRINIGIKVLIFLSILLVLTYLLKKEYWKDVKYGKWRAKD